MNHKGVLVSKSLIIQADPQTGGQWMLNLEVHITAGDYRIGGRICNDDGAVDPVGFGNPVVRSIARLDGSARTPRHLIQWTPRKQLPSPPILCIPGLPRTRRPHVLVGAGIPPAR